MLYPAQWAGIVLALGLRLLFALIKKPSQALIIIGVAIFLTYSMPWHFGFLLASSRGFQTDYLFMALSIVEAGLLLSAALEDGRLHFQFEPKPLPIIGLVFVLYALVGYPFVGMLARTNVSGIDLQSPCSPVPYERLVHWHAAND